MSENINEIAGVEPSFKIDELKFNEKGLIPAIVQDHYSKKVLMMAWLCFLNSSKSLTTRLPKNVSPSFSVGS